MKKLIFLAGIISMGVLIGGWFSANRQDESQIDKSPQSLIRFHVLANSDSDADQLLKRQVRDAILAKFSPVLGKSTSLEESRKIIKENLKSIEQEAARVIAAKGYHYPVKAVYGYFNFPVKSYGKLVLPAGRYEALRIIIGEGKGANWWCVLFPPLCFVDITSSLANNPALTEPVSKPTNSQELKPQIKFKTVEFIQQLFAKN